MPYFEVIVPASQRLVVEADDEDAARRRAVHAVAAVNEATDHQPLDAWIAPYLISTAVREGDALSSTEVRPAGQDEAIRAEATYQVTFRIAEREGIPVIE